MKPGRFLLSLSLLVPLCVVSGARASDEITYTGPPKIMRFSAYYAPVYPVFKLGIEPWMRMVERESNGKIVFKTYMGGVLHSAKDGFKAMRSNIADITTGYPAYQAGSFNLCLAADLPFASPNAWVAALVMEKLYPKYLKKEYENLGVYLAFYTNTSTYNLISKKPVRKFEDLKGMKIRSFGGTCSAMLKRLGAVPVMVQAAEIYTSFQRGILDGVLLPDNSAYSFRLHEIGKYSTAFGLTRMGIPYCMNRKTFDALPNDLKRFFYNKLRQAAQMTSGAYEIADRAAREKMIEAGVERITLPPEELQKLRDAVAPLWDDFIATNEAKGLPARQFVQEMRALTAKYASWSPEQIMQEVVEHPVQGIIDF